MLKRTLVSQWPVSRLSRHVKFHNGKDHKLVENPEGLYLVYGSGGVFAYADDYLCDGEGVLFGRKGTIDKPVYVNGKFWNVDTMYFVEPDQNVLLPKYLYYWATQFPFDYYSTNTALPSMTQADIGSEPIALPPLSEQKRIVDELDRELAEIDEFIEDANKLQKLIEEREISELEKNLIESATGFVELRRFKPRCISGTSVNAAPWKANDAEFGVLKTGVVSKGHFNPSQNKAVIEESEISRLSAPIKANTIIVNRANSPEHVGSAAFVDKDFPNLFLSDKLWQIDFEGINNEHMAALMQTRFFKEQVRQRCVGASSSMQNLSYQDFLSIKVPESKYQKIKKTYKQYNELKLLIINLEEKKISTIAEKMKGNNSESR